MVLAAIAAVYRVQEAHSRGAGSGNRALCDARVPGGSLFVSGGGCITPEIRHRFVELAGGPHARIVVIPASEPKSGNDDRYIAPWLPFGPEAVEVCHARSREMADDPAFCAHFDRATGVWFGGGNQDYLADRYVDTATQRALHALLARNGIVGGCSAGAAVLSRVMIEEGEIKPVEARGLDLISDAIVDQHFLWRNRLWRLQQMVAAHPSLYGLGVDERTALVIEPAAQRLSVVGDSYVVACLPQAGPVGSRIEVLKGGDSVLLSQLRDDHLAYQPPLEVEGIGATGD